MIERFFIWFFGENAALPAGIIMAMLLIPVFVFLFAKYIVGVEIGDYD